MSAVAPVLTIIIVNWNTAAQLRDCLRSVARETTLPHRVIVVDNASQDGSPEMIEREFPEAELIRTGANLGYAGGNNLALSLVESEYLALLNPDTIIEDGALDRLVAALDRRPATGAVGPRLRHPSGRYAIENGGWQPTIGTIFNHYSGLSRFASRRFRGLHLIADAPCRVGWLSGACLVVRRAAARGAGPLLEDWFMYAEDVEWCDRLAGHGWELWYEPGAAGVAPRPAGDQPARGVVLHPLGTGAAPALRAPYAPRADATPPVRRDTGGWAPLARRPLLAAGAPATRRDAMAWRGALVRRGGGRDRAARLAGGAMSARITPRIVPRIAPRIAIDAHMVGTGETGNETYIRGLAGGLQTAGGDHDYLLYTPDPALIPAALLGERLRARQVVPGDNIRRIGLAMPRATLRDRLDLLHATYILPPWLPCRAVVTVHDITFRTHPATFSLRDRLLLSLGVPRAMRQAAHVITISEATRRDIIRHYRLPAKKVSAIPLGVEATFRPVRDPAQIAAVRDRYELPERYVLAVGNLQPRKNLGRLIEAVAMLRATRGDDCRLVLVGQPFWRHSELTDAIAAHKLEGAVIATDYVPAEDLPAIYSAATVFAYPSLYEGFGLPPLEAMACGTPVVVGDTSSLPEVVGDAALRVDPYDTGAIAAAIARLLDEPVLVEQLRQAGFARAAMFPWSETARRTVEVYDAILANGR